MVFMGGIEATGAVAEAFVIGNPLGRTEVQPRDPSNTLE
jgi:hypothetical protein